jgi:hypothetical protein
MADAELKVRIDAEIKGFSTALKQGERELSGFSTKVNSELNKTAAAAAAASAKLGGSVAQGTDRAAFALTNLGRVAQDAPFGFIGIQNNLNPLLESFQRLKAETGTTGGALKALGQSLIGPAGLGLALSVVGAGILFYQEYQRKANKETKVAVDANKELADSILSIDDVRNKGLANASKEISSFETLYKSTQNANVPLKEKLKIAKELIDRYPKYLDGFTAEEIIAGKAASQYERLTNAILAKGYAQAAEENRQKLINQQLQARVDITKEQNELTKNQANLDKRTRQKEATLDIQGQTAIGNIIAPIQKEVDKNIAKINELNKVFNNATSEITILDNVTQDLVKTFGSEVLFDPEKPRKLKENVKSVNDILKELDTNFKKISASVDITFGDASKEKIKAIAGAIDKLIESGVKGDNPIIKRLQNQISELKPENLDKDGNLKNALTILGSQINQTINGALNGAPVVPVNIVPKLKQPFSEWGNYVNETLLPSLQGSFQTFFDDILKNGTFSFQALGKAILNTLGSVLASETAKGFLSLFKVSKGQDFTDSKKSGGLFSALLGAGGLFGKKAAAGGTAAAAAGGTAATGGLLLPILGGLAVGGIIASLFKKKPKAPTPAISTTSTTSGSASGVDFGSGTVVFQISGANLIGVLNRAGQKLQRYGG